MWDDLRNTIRPRYVTTGTTPNRIFKIEWNKQKWDYNSSGAVISFQIWLFETSNVIEYIYKREGSINGTGSATIGIYDAANTYLDLQEGVFTDHQPIHPHFLSEAPAAITAQLLKVMQPYELEDFNLNHVMRRHLLLSFQDYYALHISEFGQMKTLMVLHEVL